MKYKPVEEEQDLFWFALNYRTAGLKSAQSEWIALEAYFDKQLQAAYEAGREELRTEHDAAMAQLQALQTQGHVGTVAETWAHWPERGNMLCVDWLEDNPPVGTLIYLAAGAQPSPTALELMREYSNGKQWALEEAAKICDSTPPHPFRPSIEAAWAIRKLGEGL